MHREEFRQFLLGDPAGTAEILSIFAPAREGAAGRTPRRIALVGCNRTVKSAMAPAASG